MKIVLLLLWWQITRISAQSRCAFQTYTCQGRFQCQRSFPFLDPTVHETCNLGHRERGVCCPTNFRLRFTTPIELGPTIRSGNATRGAFGGQPGNFEGAAASAAAAVQEIRILERNQFASGDVLQGRSPETKHTSLFPVNPRFQDIGRTVLEAGITAQALRGAEGASSTRSNVNALSVFNSQFQARLSAFCPEEPICDFNARYRTIDGSCNNPINPLVGMMGTTFVRYILPQYDDGFLAIKSVGVNGAPLTSPREISSSVVADVDSPIGGLTLMLMQWGQFLDHDFSRTPIFRGVNGAGIKCCDDNGQNLPPPLLHPQCAPIDIPAFDPFYAPFNQRCMNFVRSLPGIRLDCIVPYIDQFTALTHYLDGSMIYGSDEEAANDLREGAGGRLRVYIQDGTEFPPILEDPNAEGCENKPPGAECLKAGDERINEQLSLSVMHTLWLREHNRIANLLGFGNPGWNDETIYQETRRIVVAQIQHITYGEWLPLILGQQYVTQFNLLPKPFWYSFDYSPQINPSVVNSFATAAYRFGHSLLQGRIELHEVFGATGSVELNENFNPYTLFLQSGSLDRLSRGLTRQASQSFDRFFADDVTNKLFQTNGLFGLDLVSMNIQRGRDHGLPGYNSYRQLCGLPGARTFADFGDFFTGQTIILLQNLYNHVDDVDLFVGGILEQPIGGSILGPTFRCLVGDQFFRLKWGDRYFYDLGGRPHSFTPLQLNEIRKTSLARIICDNADNIQFMQRFVLFMPSIRNPLIACQGAAVSNFIPRMDLNQWTSRRLPEPPVHTGPPLAPAHLWKKPPISSVPLSNAVDIQVSDKDFPIDPRVPLPTPSVQTSGTFGPTHIPVLQHQSQQGFGKPVVTHISNQLSDYEGPQGNQPLAPLHPSQSNSKFPETSNVGEFPAPQSVPELSNFNYIPPSHMDHSFHLENISPNLPESVNPSGVSIQPAQSFSLHLDHDLSDATPFQILSSFKENPLLSFGSKPQSFSSNNDERKRPLKFGERIKGKPFGSTKHLDANQPPPQPHQEPAKPSRPHSQPSVPTHRHPSKPLPPHSKPFPHFGTQSATPTRPHSQPSLPSQPHSQSSPLSKPHSSPHRPNSRPSHHRPSESSRPHSPNSQPSKPLQPASKASKPFFSHPQTLPPVSTHPQPAVPFHPQPSRPDSQPFTHFSPHGQPPETSLHHSQPPVTFHPQTPTASHPQPPLAYHPQNPAASHPQPPVTSHPQPPVAFHSLPPVASHPQPPLASHPQNPAAFHPQPPATSHPQPPVVSHPQPPVVSHPQSPLPPHPQQKPSVSSGFVPQISKPVQPHHQRFTSPGLNAQGFVDVNLKPQSHKSFGRHHQKPPQTSTQDIPSVAFPSKSKSHVPFGSGASSVDAFGLTFKKKLPSNPSSTGSVNRIPVRQY